MTHSFVRMWNSGNHRNDKSQDSNNGQGRLLNLLAMLQQRGWIPRSPGTSFGSVPPSAADGGASGLPTASTTETATDLQQTTVAEPQPFNITNDSTISPLASVTSSSISRGQLQNNDLEIQQSASLSTQDHETGEHFDNNISPTILHQDDDRVSDGERTVMEANHHASGQSQGGDTMVAPTATNEGPSSDVSYLSQPSMVVRNINGSENSTTSIGTSRSMSSQGWKVPITKKKKARKYRAIPKDSEDDMARGPRKLQEPRELVLLDTRCYRITWMVGSSPGLAQLTIKSPSSAELDHFVDAPECQQPLLPVPEYFTNYNGHADPWDEPSFFSPWRGNDIFEMWMVAFENPHMLSNPLFGFKHFPPQRGVTAEQGRWASQVYETLEAMGASDLLLMYLAARDVQSNDQLLHVLNEVATTRKKQSISSNLYLNFAYVYFRTCDGYKYCVETDMQILEGLYWYFQYAAAEISGVRDRMVKPHISLAGLLLGL